MSTLFTIPTSVIGLRSSGSTTLVSAARTAACRSVGVLDIVRESMPTSREDRAPLSGGRDRACRRDHGGGRRERRGGVARWRRGLVGQQRRHQRGGCGGRWRGGQRRCLLRIVQPG